MQWRDPSIKIIHQSPLGQAQGQEQGPCEPKPHNDTPAQGHGSHSNPPMEDEDDVWTKKFNHQLQSLAAGKFTTT